MRIACLRPFLSVAIVAFLAAPAVAQPPCALAYVPGVALAGVDGAVSSLLPWDPDGPGPAPQLVVAAGSFRVAGSVVSPHIAAYEPVTRQWLAIGQGLPGPANATATWPNGNLIAACNPAATAAVFEWNGASWQQLGGAFAYSVTSLAVMPNGDVVAGGYFQTIAGAPIHGVARWDGTAWQAMGAPTVPWALGAIDRIAQLPNGDLLATGLFTQIGGVACSLIARWDGNVWSPWAVARRPRRCRWR